MFALVDCNNFYASCERVFNPKLDKKPIVILSNNDGCVISRSNEAKALGITMGAPAFKYDPFFKKRIVFKCRGSHWNTKSFSFIASRNYTPIVI